MEQKQQILDVTKKYDTQLRDLRACLGFTLGQVGTPKSNVPQFLHTKLSLSQQSLKLTNQDLYQAMEAYERIVHDLYQYQSNFSEEKIRKKIKPYKREIQDLKQMLQYEQKFRRALLNQL